MNIGAILVLAKLFQDAVGVSPSVIGPPAPKDEVIPTNVPGKPICGLGRYAYQNPSTGLWSCLVIPKGR
jgi:hypothetical protein